LNQADEGLRENDRSLILSRRGGPGFVSERGSCAPSPDSGVLPGEDNSKLLNKLVALLLFHFGSLLQTNAFHNYYNIYSWI
jgi:hypothetical protein